MSEVFLLFLSLRQSKLLIFPIIITHELIVKKIRSQFDNFKIFVDHCLISCCIHVCPYGPENWFFTLDLGTTAPKTHQGVPETIRKPHKWKEHKILHRNCTQLFFQLRKIIFLRSIEKSVPTKSFFF